VSPENRKLLIASYYYPPAGGIGLPGCMRVVKFVKYLEGWDVDVLTVQPEKYPSFFKMDNNIELPIGSENVYRTSITDLFQGIIGMRDFAKNILAGKSSGGSKSEDIKSNGMPNSTLPGVENRGIPGKIKDFIHDACYFPDFASPWIPDALRSGLKIIRRNRPDIIFATGMPWSALIVANMLHRFTGVPYVCDFRDPWVGNPFHKSKGRFFDGMSKYFESTVVRKSALVTANTVPLKDQIAGRYPDLPIDRIMVLPNGYDPDDFEHLRVNGEDGHSKGELRLVHAGFLYGERNPIPILDAIKRNHETYRYGENAVQFVQIGSMEKNIEAIMSGYVESGYAKCLGQLPYRSCIETISRADVLIIIQQSTDTQIPSKIYEYISLDKPIITVTKAGGALWNLIERYEFGYLFEPEDVAAIGEKIHQLYDRKKAEGELKERYPRRADFDIRKICGKLSDSMVEICRAASRSGKGR